MCDGKGLWIVLERLGGLGVLSEEKVNIDLLSDSPVEVGAWGTGDG